MSGLNIAIIGAGPAGCSLGRLLHLASIRFTIFEGEASLDVRSQGGSLDLHTNTGLAALKRAELYDKFLEHARFDGEAMTLADKKWLKYLNMPGTKDDKSSRGRPEIDRPKLRQILLDGLPAGCIRWDKRLDRVDPSLALHFRDGSVESGFDLVVGADGAFSKVRPLLTHVEPLFSGISGYTSSIPDAQTSHPEIAALVRRGTAFAYSDGHSIIGQQMGDGSLSVAAWSVQEELPAKKLTSDEAKSLKEKLNAQLSDWSPQLKDLMLKADETAFSSRSLYMLPVGTKWTHRPGVTCVGDAAHLMTPHAGEGVNLALADTMYLADAIIATNTSISNPPSDGTAVPETASLLSRHIEAFEADMFKRCTPVQQQTVDMMELMFMTPGAPRTSIERYILTAVRDEVPGWAFPFVSALVHGYYFVFKLIW